jgi:hypothetical protein
LPNAFSNAVAFAPMTTINEAIVRLMLSPTFPQLLRLGSQPSVLFVVFLHLVFDDEVTHPFAQFFA